MSNQELISAYVDGRVSRRVLIRRLVAGGVSLGAAVAYSHLLQPQRAPAAASGGDHYPQLTVRIVEQPLGKVVENGKVRVRVTSDEQLSLGLKAYLIRKNGVIIMALSENKQITFGPDSRRVAIPLTTSGINALAARDKARIAVRYTGCDTASLCPNAQISRVFTR